MPPSLTDAPRILPAAVLAFALLGALSWGGWRAVTQVRMAPGTAIPAQALSPQPHAARSSTVRPVRMPEPAETGGPAWDDLTPAQQEALAPLNERWPVLSEAQKRHWLNLAASFRSLPHEERRKMVERMTEWANLSIQQRNQARFNYAVTSRLTADNKLAKWEAYQALSPEEKHRLAAHAAPKPAGAATALRPSAARKLAKVPAATAAAAKSAGAPNLPKIPRINETHALQALPVPTAWPMMPASASGVGVETAPVSMPAAAVVTPLPPGGATTAPAASQAEPLARDLTPLHPPQ